MVRKEQSRIQDHACYGLFVATAYGVCSVTITLFNKAVFSFYDFKFPITLFIAQMLFSLTFVSILKAYSPEKYGFPVTLALSKKLLPMALGWVTYGISGVIALKYLNVPMFSAFRRFTTIMVMYGEYKLNGKLPPRDQQAAVLTMCAGAAIAGLTDLAFSLPGYCWVITCAVSTALYLLFIDKLGKESGLNTFGLMFYNNMLAMPVMVVALLASGELALVPLYPRLYHWDFQLFFVASAMQAFFLNFLIFLCTRVNSPLITSVTGTVKDLFTNMLGMTLFGDFPFNPPNVLSIGVCFGGSVWYSRLKYLASHPPKGGAGEKRSTAGELKELEEGKALLGEAGGEKEGGGGGGGGAGVGGGPGTGLDDLLRKDQHPAAAAAAGGGAAAGAAAAAGGAGGAGVPAAALYTQPPPQQQAQAGASGGGSVGGGGGGDKQLLERKKALEAQLAELEAQMAPSSHHTD